MDKLFELTQLLTKDIPQKQVNEDGFLEIIKMSNRELVNSRIYAYFLNQKNNPLVAASFINALIQIIKAKSKKEIILNNYTCSLEVSTKKGRIDLVIEDRDLGSVIIIENKLFYHLHNDLVDYWEHYKKYDESKKVGILLTLEKHEIPTDVQGEFINIKHHEWITTIQERGLPSDIPIKTYVYLNDFFQTIKNLSKNNKMNEQAAFFFQHSRKVLQIRDTIHEAEKFMENQFSILAEKLDLDLYGNSMEWKNLWDEGKERKTYYTIVFSEIMRGGNSVQIIIELEGEDMERAEKIHKLLEGDEAYKRMNKNGEVTKDYIHFARLDYTLSIEEISTFADFIYRRIKEDFESTMNKIINYLDKKEHSE